jgi:hypothetical protein
MSLAGSRHGSFAFQVSLAAAAQAAMADPRIVQWPRVLKAACSLSTAKDRWLLQVTPTRPQMRQLLPLYDTELNRCTFLTLP